MATVKAESRCLKNGDEFILRSASRTDSGKIIELITTVFKEREFTVTRPEEFKLTEQEQEAFIEEILISDSDLMIVAECRNELIGLLSFTAEKKRIMAHTGSFGINVRRDFRDQGVGRHLVDLLISWGEKEPTIEKICLSVFANNERAIALYKRLGFVEEGRRVKAFKTEKGSYIDEILMYKNVGG